MDSKSNVLLVGESLGENDSIMEMLGCEHDLYVSVANTVDKAIDYVFTTMTDVILVSASDGIEGERIIDSLRENDDVSSISVLLVVDGGCAGSDDCFLKGYADYVVLGGGKREFMGRLRTHIGIRKTKRLLNKKDNELVEAYGKIDQLALIDSLTGISNRRSILGLMEKEASRSRRNGVNFSIIMCDIDNFKVLNEKYGHTAGDGVLSAIADVIQKSLRYQDIVSRWGGEEFLVMLPETKVDNAFNVAEKLRSRIEAEEFDCCGEKLKVTMTFGVAAYETDLGLSKSLHKAEDALLAGKERGRNMVVQAVTKLRNTL